MESGFATEDDLDECLSSMILLARGDEDEASIAKMLKKNGFGGHAIPAKLNEDADITDFFDMDFRYSCRWHHSRTMGWLPVPRLRLYIRKLWAVP